MALVTTVQAGNITSQNQVITNYIQATTVDTTATVNGFAIGNRDGKINSIYLALVVEDNTAGSSPTLTMRLQGSVDGTNFFTLKDTGGNVIATSALDISGCDNTAANYVIDALSSQVEGISTFPPFLRAQLSVGGTSSPNWKGSVSVVVKRAG